MYPYRTRGVLSVLKTHNDRRRLNHPLQAVRRDRDVSDGDSNPQPSGVTGRIAERHLATSYSDLSRLQAPANSAGRRPARPTSDCNTFPIMTDRAASAPIATGA